MIRVIYNGVTTEEETTIHLAARLAACCGFYYAESGKKMQAQGRKTSYVREVWLVLSSSKNTWRVVDPQSWLDDDEEVIAYKIDGRKSEGETGREILKLIESDKVIGLTEHVDAEMEGVREYAEGGSVRLQSFGTYAMHVRGREEHPEAVGRLTIAALGSSNGDTYMQIDLADVLDWIANYRPELLTAALARTERKDG